MHATLVGVWVSLSFLHCGVAAAQDAPEGTTDVANETTTGADVSQPAPETQVVETEAAPASEGAGLDHPRPAPASPERAVIDDEVPPSADEPLEATAEVFVGLTPSFSFGGLGGLGALAGLAGVAELGLSGGADLVFAADRRTLLGLGLSIAHSELAGTSFMPTTVSNRVRVPLIAQFYLDEPRRGQAVPTLRIVPSFFWSYAEGTSTPARLLGGGLAAGIGITWFVLDFLAVRILADVGTSLAFSYEGPEANQVSAYIGANVGVVARL